jgi:hypothetical protein
MKIQLIIAFLFLCTTAFAQKDSSAHRFVIGDEEYRSEESMPMLGEIYTVNWEQKFPSVIR